MNKHVAAMPVFLLCSGLAAAQSSNGVPCGAGRTTLPCLVQALSPGKSAPAAVRTARSSSMVVPPAPGQPHRRAVAGSGGRIASPVELPEGKARWRFFPNGAALAAGVNLKAWREAGLYGKLSEQLEAAGAPAGAWEGFRAMAEQVDEVWIMVEASAGKQAQPVVLLTGKFTNAGWKQAFPAAPSLESANAVLAGEPLAVAAARRRLHAQVAPGKLALEAEGLSQANDVWLTGLPALLPRGAADGAAGSQQAALLKSVERFSLTMSVREKLTGSLSLHTSTPEAAGQLLAMYRMVEAQAASANPKEWEPLAKALTVESDSSDLRFKISVDPKDLTPVVAARMRAAAAPVKTAVARRVIKIQGLEDGPREIPFDGPR